jgi:hypothetical protein
MAKFNFAPSEQTGDLQASFPGKLISISEKALTNVNGTNYKIATINFENSQGAKENVSAFVYEGNYSKTDDAGNALMVVGGEYNCTVTLPAASPDKPIITVSHLPASGQRATASAFGVSNEQVAQITSDAAAAASM